VPAHARGEDGTTAALEAFAERVVSLARARYPEATFERAEGDALRVSVAWPDGAAGDAHLDNVWRDYQRAPDGESADDVVARFLAALGPLDRPTRRADLVAIVRSRETLQACRSADEEPTPKNTVLARPLVADLMVVIAFDLPDCIALATEHDVEALGVSKQTAYGEALTNVLSSLDVRRRGEGPLSMLTAGGNYEASLLLHTALWRQLAAEVAGSLIASVPCRDLLYFTGTAEEGGEEALRAQTALMVREGSYPLSAAILRFTGEGWVAQGAEGP